MRIIDTHTHVGRLLHNLPPNRPEDLLATMDREGIDQAVVVAVENPEELDYYFTTEQVLEVCRQHPDRLIPFCNLDPRHRYPDRFDPRPIIQEYLERGCRGFGEILAGVPIDHPCLQAIYGVCGELHLPVLFHTDHLICADEPGMPRLERLLQQFPATTFIGHAQHFWGEISADAAAAQTQTVPYPEGPVTPVGAADRLLTTYPNLCADLSARSGYNALTRDPTFGLDFLERHQDKLLFATDTLQPGRTPAPIAALIRACAISETAREKICYGNAVRLLGL